MITTTDEAFTAAVRAAVADRGEDYVYPREWRMTGGLEQTPAGYAPRGTCRYAQPDGSGPACIIGYAMHRLGVNINQLDALDSHSPDASTAMSHFLEGISVVAQCAADDAQSLQDQELSWGAALEAFERRLTQSFNVEDA